MKEVIGYYPNWISPEIYKNLRYDALTTISYAFASITGEGNLNKFNYTPDDLIQEAHKHNVKVVLSVNSEWASPVIDTMLSSDASQDKLVSNIASEIQSRNFDGVDIDLEGMPNSNRVNGQLNSTLLTTFMKKLSEKLWSVNPKYRISIALPAVDWNEVFDVTNLQKYTSFLMIMGYDYHWQTGPTAGAVAPLYSSNGISVSDSVNKYLLKVPKEKLLLGVPYYGYEWSTTGTLPDASTNGGGMVLKYNDAIANASKYGRQWSSEWSCPYYIYGNNQGWYDDVESLGLKYDLVNQKELAGIGIWALGYDNNKELPDLILKKFADANPNPTPTPQPNPEPNPNPPPSPITYTFTFSKEDIEEGKRNLYTILAYILTSTSK